jgi:beta-galactosidase/beta-glucuronidase
MTLPRPEHPRPQFERSDWLNLNGTWSFALDPTRTGVERGFAESQGFDSEILVPFCPESKLSGVGHLDFIPGMWYHRELIIPENWSKLRALLHFGGVDYESEVFVDGKSAGMHFGGTSSFCHDITPLVRPGQTHHLVIRVHDDTRSNTQPCGKQSQRFGSYGCLYTRTTGIWQTVWLEGVSPWAISDCGILPDLDGSRFVVTPRFRALRSGLLFRAVLSDDGCVLAERTSCAANGVPVALPIASPRTWSPDDPHLYDLSLEVRDEDGAVLDSVQSYAGLRKVHIEGDRILLNNEPLFLRLVLDQGFYPDGIWTAPSDDALRSDIELSMAAGFNGARLHQKVFEERFHCWADRLGYLTWGESSSWGCNVNDPVAGRNFLAEWREIVLRDRNHPSIIAWTPLNETRDMPDPTQHHRLHVDAYDLTKALDPTRPINDASGYVHIKTDLWTVHNYDQNPDGLRETIALDPETGVWRNFPDVEADYAGQPYVVDEFGGIKWIPQDQRAFASDSWGYGTGPTTEDDFYKRLEGLVDVVLSLEHIRGYCYTQLTDVEQEQNGIYNYDRSPKFDMQRVSEIFRRDP